MALRLRRLELIFWGAVLALAFYPLDLGFLAWIALARPLLILAPLSPKAAFKSGYLFSFVFNLVSIYWIAHVSPPGALAAIAILSIYSAALFSLLAFVHKRKATLALFLFPAFWVAHDYFRTLSEFSFPWSDISYSQAQYEYFIQIAAVTGAGGVTFLVVLLNSFLAITIDRSRTPEFRISCAGVAVLLVALNFGYGWIQTPAIPERGDISVGLLQGNFTLGDKWSPQKKDLNFKIYDSLAGLAGADGAELIIWPETSAPTYMLRDRAYVLGRTKNSRSTGATNLIGTMHAALGSSPIEYYNAAVQIDSAGEFSAPYLKLKLVPFAEQVPYQNKLPFLKRSFLEKYLTFIETYDVDWWSDYQTGDSMIIMEFPGGEYATLICFEVAYPDYVRDALNKGADFLVTITNDTWFKRSPGPFQHRWIVIMRAVENRTWIARAANSGFTFIVDPYGQIREYLKWYERGYVVGNVKAMIYPSLYNKYGPILTWVCFGLTVSLAVWAVISSLLTRRKR